MKMKNLFLILIVMISVFFVFDKLIVDESVIRIGILGDFSTSEATESIDAYRAIELALEEINEIEKRYDFVRIDFPKYSSLKDLKNAIERENVQLIIGPSTSTHYSRLKPILQELELPIFLVAVSSNDVNEKVDNLFRLSDDITNHSDALEYIIKKYLNNENCIIYYTTQNKGFSESLALYLSQSISEETQDNVPKLIEIGDISNINTHNLLLEKRDEKCAVIIAPPGTAGNIGQFIAQGNPEITLVFSEWSTSKVTFEYLKDLSNTLYFLSAPPPDYLETFEVFSKKIVDEKRGNNNIFSLTGYELIYFIDWVLTKSPSAKLVDVADVIHNTDTYYGRFNKYTFNSYGDGKRGYGLYTGKKGKYILLADKLNFE